MLVLFSWAFFIMFCNNYWKVYNIIRSLSFCYRKWTFFKQIWRHHKKCKHPFFAIFVSNFPLYSNRKNQISMWKSFITIFFVNNQRFRFFHIYFPLSIGQVVDPRHIKVRSLNQKTWSYLSLTLTSAPLLIHTHICVKSETVFSVRLGRKHILAASSGTFFLSKNTGHKTLFLTKVIYNKKYKKMPFVFLAKINRIFNDINGKQNKCFRVGRLSGKVEMETTFLISICIDNNNFVCVCRYRCRRDRKKNPSEWEVHCTFFMCPSCWRRGWGRVSCGGTVSVVWSHPQRLPRHAFVLKFGIRKKYTLFFLCPAQGLPTTTGLCVCVSFKLVFFGGKKV